MNLFVSTQRIHLSSVSIGVHKQMKLPIPLEKIAASNSLLGKKFS